MQTAEASEQAPTGVLADNETGTYPNGMSREHLLLELLTSQLAEKDKTIAELTAKLVEQQRPRPEFIDIGFAAFNVEAIEVVGIWAEQNKPGEPTDPETPRIRVFGESFTITEETLWYVQQALGIPAPETDTHDKYAALTDENSCLNRAALSEPIFILRAQDSLSASVVREWADRAESNGCGTAKVAEARLVAQMMENYPVHKLPD